MKGGLASFTDFERDQRLHAGTAGSKEDRAPIRRSSDLLPAVACSPAKHRNVGSERVFSVLKTPRPVPSSSSI